MDVTETYPTPEPLVLTPRRRERRRGLDELVSALARHLHTRSDPTSMRTGFEEVLRNTLAVRAVHLRDAPSRWLGPPEGGSAAESLALDVPGAQPGGRRVLAVTVEPGRRLDDWEYQILGSAAQIGALVL